MNLLITFHFLSLIMILIIIGITYPFKKIRVSEKVIAQLFYFAGILSILLCFSGISYPQPPIELNLFNLIQLHFETNLFFVYLFMSVLLATTSHFSFKYIHKDIGFYKFFLNLALFWLGLFLFTFSGNHIMIISGWELIGISSIFLISYYNYRKGPVQSSLFVLTFYKLSDILLITSLLFLKFNSLNNYHPSFEQYLYLGLIISGFIKSASFPFTSWLPRAMEGPTSSSAIFYAALSLNTGVLLIYKFHSQILEYELCRLTLLTGGILTVLYSSVQSRVQSDIKACLAYSTSVQIGLVIIELSLGFSSFALLHLFSSSILKIYQFIRTPSLIHIYHSMEGKFGTQFGRTGIHFQYLIPKRLRIFIYHLALNHFYIDSLYEFTRSVFQKIGKILRYLFVPIIGNNDSVQYPTLMWIGYYIFTIFLLSFGFINAKSINFIFFPISLLCVSLVIIFERNSNSFIALFTVYKILESYILYSIFIFDPYKFASMILSGFFALVLVFIFKRNSSYNKNKLFFSSVTMALMLFFTNFPFLAQSLTNEHIIEALISNHHFTALALYGFANTFFNIGLYNFIFKKIYLMEVIDG